MKIYYRRFIRISLFIILLMIVMPGKAKAAELNGNGSTDAPVITVTFNANGGEVDLDSIQAAYGDPYGELPKPKRKNYIFKGWYTFASGGIEITDKSIVNTAVPQTLYAQWSGKQVVITLNAGGGKLKSNKVKVYFGSKYYNQLPVPTKDNYIFDGWYSSAGNSDMSAEDNGDMSEDGTIEDNADTSADGTAEDYGDMSADDPNPDNYDTLSDDSTSAENSDTASDGSTAEEKTEKITAGSIFTEKSSKTLIAKWKVKTVKVIFYGLNGESFVREAQRGKAIGELPVPVRENYSFGGWYLREDYTNYKAKTITAESKINSNSSKVQLYARWYIAKKEN